VDLKLQKSWLGGVAGDTVDLSLDGVNDDSDTSTATGGNQTDTTNTADITVLVGETVTLSEVLGAGNTGDYTASFDCDAINPPSYTPGDTRHQRHAADRCSRYFDYLYLHKRDGRNFHGRLRVTGFVDSQNR
jgi:hypothetical protein